MPQEFEGDLADAEFWGANLSGARFRDVDLSRARVSHARLIDVEIDAYVDRLVVNGVDVTAFVNQHDPWYPVRTVLAPPTVEGARRSAQLLSEAWDAAVTRANRLPEGSVDESVGGEWSFLQTLRHLVLARDKWFEVPILGGRYHALGLVDSGSRSARFEGVDPDADPSLGDVLAVRAEQAGALAGYLETLSEAELEREVDVDDVGAVPVADCLFTVFEEEFWHLRYATRDLESLETR